MEDRWVASYAAGVPRTLQPYPDRTLLDYLADAARDDPDGTALWFKGRTISWSALEKEAEECASAFDALEIGRGDRVALVLPNCPQFLFAEYGAWKVGAVVCPLNPIYTEEEIRARLLTLAPRVVVTLPPFYDRICAPRTGTAVEHVIATNIKEFFPALLRLAFTFAIEKKLGHPGLPGRHAHRRLHHPGVGDRLDLADYRFRSRYFSTSGTSSESLRTPSTKLSPT